MVDTVLSGRDGMGFEMQWSSTVRAEGRVGGGGDMRDTTALAATYFDICYVIRIVTAAAVATAAASRDR